MLIRSPGVHKAISRHMSGSEERGNPSFPWNNDDYHPDFFGSQKKLPADF